MATLTNQPTPLLATFFGGKKPESNPKDRTRLYACELKWNSWQCHRTEETIWTPKSDTLATQLVSVSDSIPSFFDSAIVSYKLRKPVFLNHTDFPKK